MTIHTEIVAPRPSSEPALARSSKLIDIMIGMLIEERAKVAYLSAKCGLDPDELPDAELQPYVDAAMVGVPMSTSMRAMFDV